MGEINDTARIAREYIAKLEAENAGISDLYLRIDTLEAERDSLARQLKRKTIAKTCLSRMYENTREENRRILTAVERHRESISTARQADGEHGAYWLDEGAVREWRADNKYLSQALKLFMDDLTLEGE